MESSIRTGQKNSLSERFVPDIRTAYHISFMHYRKVNSDWYFPSHEHKQYELNYVAAGTQIFVLNGVTHVQRTGDCMLLRPGDIHASQAGGSEGLAYLCIHFDADDGAFIELLEATNVALLQGHAEENTAFRLSLEAIKALISTGEDNSLQIRMQFQSLFFQTLSLLCGALSTHRQSKGEKQQRTFDLAHRIASMIEARSKQPLYHGSEESDRMLIRDVASTLGISDSHCNRTFREVFGISPRRYLSSLMLEEAKKLLLQTVLRIEHISQLLGYRDIAHFSRQFKRWTGESPEPYRRRHRLPQPSEVVSGPL